MQEIIRFIKISSSDDESVLRLVYNINLNIFGAHFRMSMTKTCFGNLNFIKKNVF